MINRTFIWILINLQCVVWLSKDKTDKKRDFLIKQNSAWHHLVENEKRQHLHQKVGKGAEASADGAQPGPGRHFPHSSSSSLHWLNKHQLKPQLHRGIKAHRGPHGWWGDWHSFMPCPQSTWFQTSFQSWANLMTSSLVSLLPPCFPLLFDLPFTNLYCGSHVLTDNMFLISHSANWHLGHNTADSQFW